MRREPIVAGMFYPADPDRCRAEVERMLQEARRELPTGHFFAGLVPHAGWAYSGATAARTFAALAASATPSAVVLLGAVHHWGIRQASIYARGSWETPLGSVAIEEELAAAILEEGKGLIAEDPHAHLEEHAIEVQLPFIQYLFPSARIVPLSVPPEANAVPVGEAVARAAQRSKSPLCLVGSTDLTHYGPHYGYAPRGVGQAALTWARENDRRLIDLVLQLRAEDIVPQVAEDRSACGAGAIAATVAAARSLGARRGILLGYTTSYDVQPTGSPADFVGYAAVAF